jgi:hypothetical protein
MDSVINSVLEMKWVGTELYATHEVTVGMTRLPEMVITWSGASVILRKKGILFPLVIIPLLTMRWYKCDHGQHTNGKANVSYSE